jgi:hypothetical protein
MLNNYPASLVVPGFPSRLFPADKTGLKKIFLLLFLFFLVPGLSWAQVTFTNFEEARLVIGQSSFTAQSTTANDVNTPAATALALSGSGPLAVSSQTAGRVLIWHTRPLTNGQPADVVVGKPDFTTTTYTVPAAGSMKDCSGLAFSPDGKKLLVSDAQNNRVLIWNRIPTTNGQAADVVIGQNNFTEVSAGTAANKLNYPAGLLVTAEGKLLINDVLNSRVLVFNAIPATPGAAADVIIGQPGINTNATGTAANQMNQPWYSAVAPDGRLLISDSKNNRILIYNSIPTTHGASANLVIGQPGFNSNPASGIANNKLNSPLGLTVSEAGQLAVADFANNRVLLFNAIPSSNGAAADVVLGQPNFASNTEYNGGISAKSLAGPTGVQYDFNGRVFVSAHQGKDGRVLVFGNPTGKMADLGITSTATMALPCREITLQYQVGMLNNGPNLATNVSTTLFLPAELMQQAAPVVSAGTFTPANGTWTLPTLDPGKTATITFSGTVSGTASGRVIRQNALIRSSGQVDPNPGNNVSGTELTVIGSLPPAPASASVTICTGNDTTLTAVGLGILRWYNAASNGIPLATGTTFNTGILTASTTYYVEDSNDCLFSNRTPVKVTVNPLISNNTIAGAQAICQNQAPATLTGSVPSGGNGNYTYQWQISNDNENWQDHSIESRSRQKDLNPGGLNGTTYFRRRVIAGPCAYAYSNVIRVDVNPLPFVSFSIAGQDLFRYAPDNFNRVPGRRHFRRPGGIGQHL